MDIYPPFPGAAYSQLSSAATEAEAAAMKAAKEEAREQIYKWVLCTS